MFVAVSLSSPFPDRRGPVGDSTIAGRSDMAFSNQITQAINSTASGPHGTCQSYAIVVYLTISRILSNTRRRVVEGASLCRLGSSLLAYTGRIFVPYGLIVVCLHYGLYLCAYGLIVARLHYGLHLCLRTHRCAPTYGLHLCVLGLIVAPIRMLISPLWLYPPVVNPQGRVVMDKPASRALSL